MTPAERKRLEQAGWRNLSPAGDEGEEALIPYAVARANTVQGKSMLKAWRHHLGITQKELAEKVGVKQPAIANMERPGHKLQRVTLRKLAVGLGITVAQLRGVG